MSAQPYIPRRAAIVGLDGAVSRDWDKWFQGIAQALALLTPAGTYANNAAALAAGLLVGQFYQTAAGEVRVVV